MKYTDAQIQKLLDGIYDGSITEYDLPDDLYGAIADYLKKGVYEGFGKTLYQATGKDLELLAQLRDNVYMFSAAKTFQQVKDISGLLIDEAGNLRTSKEFNALGAAAYDTWNNVWGKTEYNTAVGQANQANKWLEVEKNKSFLPNLRYSAVMDPNTSDICRPLDGMVAPVDDPVWNTIAPLNHFNCRCVLEQVDEDTKPTEGNGDRVKGVENEMQDLFKMNCGKDGYIFKEDHPYFQVEKKDKAYAERNFDLPIPSAAAEAGKDIPGEVAQFTPARTIAEAEAYAINELSMEYAHYKGLDLAVANDMNAGLFKTKKLFPELPSKGTGSAQAVNKAIKADVKAAYLESDHYKAYLKSFGPERAAKYAEKIASSSVRKISSGTLAFSQERGVITVAGRSVDLSKYKGAFFNEARGKSAAKINEAVVRNIKSGWWVPAAPNAGQIVAHELGHEIDVMLRLNKNADFRAIFNREHAKGLDHVTSRLSRYGATAGKTPSHRDLEMIAESWAEYTTAKAPRELATEIGELILKEYYEKYKQSTGTTFTKWRLEALKIIKE